MYSNGGVLHGSWTLDSAAVTSDARLKTDIKPLQETLYSLQQSQSEEKSEGRDADAANAAQWFVSQLRPVSFRYSDSGGQRYGFIADDVEQILPELVHVDENRPD